MNKLSERKIFSVANRLHTALEIAENDVMLHSEVLCAFRDAKAEENFTQEFCAELDAFLDSIVISI